MNKIYIACNKNTDVDILMLKDKIDVDKNYFSEVTGIKEDNVLFAFLSNFYSISLINEKESDKFFNLLRENNYYSLLSNEIINGFYGVILSKYHGNDKEFENSIAFFIPCKCKFFYDKLLTL